MRALPLLACLSLAACAQVPGLDTPAAERALAAPYPELVPLETLLAAAERDPRITVAEAEALQRRAAALGGIDRATSGDLAERAARLRERAEALRAADLDA
ncbi:hypothetical protein [Tranquillimonas alkanivorans]|uniref:Uncharacterized protein n=1 Tax=Tranquillimonas alkanivorans TaxID=441119 RepID=A0A1I5SLZ5_9RHOB|nr:hypothetical protein [Tranquillimonas alkanivorans]SFP71770.1 hypothetical protein SAMN04488047_11187 [Tranquillimonas alkanivorans]